AQLCIRLDNEIRAFKQRNQPEHRSPTSNNKPHKDHHKDHKTPRPERSTQYTGEGAYLGPGPMELGNLSRNPKKLSPDERRNRMDNKLCLYCGGPGHQVKDCPNTRRGSQPMA